ncbi:MAG TPA: hypothetical protein VN030_08340 [Cellvibrio sp.]|nr:hypothetical protein [Cellvibrio sp.]
MGIRVQLAGTDDEELFEEALLVDELDDELGTEELDEPLELVDEELDDVGADELVELFTDEREDE